jgi:catecholate siderophore receptor
MIRSMQSRNVASLLAIAIGIGSPGLAWGEELVEAPSITVIGEHSDYHADDADATKTGTPLLDTPQSVTTLSRAQLDDQGVEQLNDALRYVPGVTLGQGEGHRDQIVLRGQSTTADFYLDGLRDDAQYYRPLYNTERVEVLKGANALLFGRGGGGGVINRESKEPNLDRAQSTVAGGVDSFGAWSLSGDFNQPFSAGAALRLNATYETFANHRDVYDGHFIGLAPTLKASLSERTTLVLAYEYVEDRRITDRGVPSLGGVPIAGFDQTFFGDPVINHSEVTAHIARTRIEHEFSDSLSANFTGSYATTDKFYGNVLPSAATATTVTLTGYNNGIQRSNWIGQSNLVWKGATGPLRHTLLLGFEAADQDTANIRSDARFAAPAGSPTASTTVPLARRLTLPAVSFTAPTNNSTSHVRALSAYIQDQIELGEHLQIIGGVRYDDFRISSINLVNGFAGQRQDGKWSPRLGLILKPQPNISIYASYAKSFLPQAGDQFTVLAANTASLAPEEFRNLEAGVKWDLGGSLSFTSAVFQIDRSNTRVPDPAISGFFLQGGKSRVRGFEAALSGKILPEWQLTIGYAHQQGEIRAPIASGTTTIPAGRKLDKLPRDQITAWTRYDLTPKLGLGLGLVHQARQFATISNEVRLPGFTRLDAALYYDLSDRLALQLNVENLTDAHYFPTAHTDNNISTGEPINARITVRVKF